MYNLVFGILTVAIVTVGYFLAFRSFNQNKVRQAIYLVVVCGLLLRIFTSTDLYPHAWDERYHALVAKHLIDHPLKPTLYENPVAPYDYTNWWHNHIWVHKQPVPLWSMALSMSIFGLNMLALRLPSILLSTLGIWLIYAIGRDLFGKRVGFIAAFLLSTHSLTLELTGGRVATDHIDLYFMVFIELAVYLAIRFAKTKKPWLNLLCGVSIGLAILSKWLPALIVCPIWLLLLLDSKKFTFKQILGHGLLLCLSITAIALPWQVFIHLQYPAEAAWESEYNALHITEVLDNQGGPWYYHFAKMPVLFGELIFIPVAWYLYKMIKRPLHYKRLTLVTWFLIPFLFFSFVATKMQGYTIFTAPALFIITALFWVYLRRIRLRYYTILRWTFSLLMILLLMLPVRYTIERIQPFKNIDRNPEWTQEIKNLEISNDSTVIFGIDNSIEAMFYQDCTAYSAPADSNTVKDLEQKGYTVIQWDKREK